jgi:hypothetical protein
MVCMKMLSLAVLASANGVSPPVGKHPASTSLFWRCPPFESRRWPPR